MEPPAREEIHAGYYRRKSDFLKNIYTAFSEDGLCLPALKP